MHQKLLNIFYIVLVAILVLGSFYIVYFKESTHVDVSKMEYKNTEYGFSISLPDSWKGYSIVTTEWSGDRIDSKGNLVAGTEKGPLISVRHPAWTTENPRQDIPIMIFTLQQWNDMQADKFHIGAAPINPSELGRNSEYVFALPARYNFSYLTGFEEVDQIIQGNNFSTF